jgi:hypothetical protein
MPKDKKFDFAFNQIPEPLFREPGDGTSMIREPGPVSMRNSTAGGVGNGCGHPKSISWGLRPVPECAPDGTVVPGVAQDGTPLSYEPLPRI